MISSVALLSHDKTSMRVDPPPFAAISESQMSRSFFFKRFDSVQSEPENGEQKAPV